MFNKITFSLPLSIAFIASSLSLQATPKCDIPYEVLMGMSQSAIHTEGWSLREQDKAEMNSLAKSYVRNLKFIKKHQHNIPHVIHCLWLGPKPLPQEGITNLQLWKKHHQKWKIVLWTDSKNQPLPIPGMVLRDLHEYNFEPLQACINQATTAEEKSNLMRFVILYNEGGLFTTPYTRCLQPFTPLADSFDFVTCTERMRFFEEIDSFIRPSSELFLSKPKHPILFKTVCAIAAIKPTSPLGTPQIKSCFSQCCKQFHDKDKNHDLILPTAYFYAHITFQQPFVRQLNALGYEFACVNTPQAN
jgi:mannosyltransferase OCH1-like enzyme